ncbi:hypothetical protein BCR41DRAFT_157905 [Lobosporangium transversale]|uniref:Uncharacterized protein n=1 Tax=Lobosporangium transversale TaxID=64571 RepID=A0A1Y2GDB5_9FUNG|nr:hypothetical protein BCR41DRAFT_157905 [Lobosporangium transversale]ORZ07712.1 hypothetical protein BCR41DRAFT_157905 [Lobosporangium transversale]|eukprot:XP_021878078.1 hypothetical protein BCR41DRAFT_157905 [Lobosporangium transversale]
MLFFYLFIFEARTCLCDFACFLFFLNAFLDKKAFFYPTPKGSQEQQQNSVYTCANVLYFQYMQIYKHTLIDNRNRKCAPPHKKSH